MEELRDLGWNHMHIFVDVTQIYQISYQKGLCYKTNGRTLHIQHLSERIFIPAFYF